jgi:hypothetical protein
MKSERKTSELFGYDARDVPSQFTPREIAQT